VSSADSSTLVRCRRPCNPLISLSTNVSPADKSNEWCVVALTIADKLGMSPVQAADSELSWRAVDASLQVTVMSWRRQCSLG
jgi:hypothetical protein